MRSADGGATFTPVAGLEGQFIFGFARGTGDVVWANANSAIYRSTDGGATFVSTGDVPGFFSEQLLADAVEPDTAYSTAGGQIYTTRDGGVTWTTPDPPVPGVPGSFVLSVTVDGAAAGRVWLMLAEPTGGVDEFAIALYRSDDYAATFVRVGVPPGDGTLSVDASGALYTGDLGAINRSLDGGVSWTVLPTAGLPAQRFFNPVIADAQPGVLYVTAGRDGVFTLGR